jgi:hypothetical protein
MADPSADVSIWPAPQGRGDDPLTGQAVPEVAPRTVVLGLGLHPALLVGVLPEITVAVAPSVDLLLEPSFDLRFSVLAALPVTADLQAEAGEVRGQAEVFQMGGRIDGCWGADRLDGVVRTRACGGVHVAAVPIDGVAGETPDQSVVPWVAIAGRLDLMWAPRRSRFGLGLGVDGYVPFLRPDLVALDDEGAIVASRAFPPVGAAVSLGPMIVF